MIYIFDSNAFRVVGNYYPEAFPSFWEEFNGLVTAGNLMSVREVRLELDRLPLPEHIETWVKDHKDIFNPPTDEESEFVGKIFEVEHFRGLVGKQNILEGMPVADPFLIASAKCGQGVLSPWNVRSRTRPGFPTCASTSMSNSGTLRAS